MSVSGNLKWIRLVMVLQLSVSFLHLKVKNFPGQNVSHAFQGPGGWYIENSLTTLGQKDPVSEYNRELWNSGSDKDKETVRKQKRKLSYYSNIYVVKDPANPQTKVKSSCSSMVRRSLIRSWKQCNLSLKMKLLSILLTSGKGANFKLKIVKKDGYWNYDKSEFDSRCSSPG
jgi:hypothetical protein